MYRSKNFEVGLPLLRGKHYSAVLVNETDGGIVFRHSQDDDIKDRIESAWQRLLAKAQEQVDAGKRKGLPFSGPLYRFGGVEKLLDSAFQIVVGHTDFRESVGTNWEAGMDLAYKELLERRGKDVSGSREMAFELYGHNYFADALASCVAIKTRTEAGEPVYVVGMRSFEQDEYPLSLHVPGTLGNRKAFQGRTYDPFEGAWLECLSKEFALERGEVTDMYCSGLVLNRPTEKPELTFVAEVSVPFEKLAADRHQKAPERAEHFGIFPVTRDQLLELLSATQDPADARFLDRIKLPEQLRERVKAQYAERPGIIVNTHNWWAPPGEACLVLALANDGVDPAKELSYIERT